MNELRASVASVRRLSATRSAGTSYALVPVCCTASVIKMVRNSMIITE